MEVLVFPGLDSASMTPLAYETALNLRLTEISAGTNVLVVPIPGGTMIAYGDGLPATLTRLKKTNVANVAYQALVSDALIAYTSLTAGRIVTLPAVADTGASATRVHVITVVDESGDAGTYNITVDGSGAETIDGAANYAIGAAYGFATFYTNGTEWFLLAASQSLTDSAAAVVYVPGDNDDWGTNPDDVKEALDQLALRLTDAEADPVLDMNDVTDVSTTPAACAVDGVTVIAGGTGLAGLTLAAPTAGSRATILLETISSGSVIVTTATGVTFDGTNNTATFNAAADLLELVYRSATRWQIVRNTSVTLSAV